jgi:hypothetical protein
MSRYKRVVSGGPPFALDLCVRKVCQLSHRHIDKRREKVTPIQSHFNLIQASSKDMAEIDLRRVAGIVVGSFPSWDHTITTFNQYRCVILRRGTTLLLLSTTTAASYSDVAPHFYSLQPPPLRHTQAPNRFATLDWRASLRSSRLMASISHT